MLLARTILIAATTIVVSLIAWAGAAMQTAAPQEDYRDPDQNPAYYQAGPFLDGYHFNEMPLDPASRFYPSSATTLSGDYYSQEKLMDVERCGDAGCHPDIYSQWYESTHHLASFNDPWYRRTFQFFDERSGRRPAQWCAGCHDPAVMMTGELVASAEIDFESPGASIGISCQFCHSVGAIDPAHTNASYQLSPSYPLPFEGTTDPAERAEGNRMLLEDEELIRRHKGDRRKPFLVLGEFCGTCHKQSLITPVNNYKWLRGFDEFDGWQNSGIPGYSARSFYYPESPMTCQNCHMPEVPSNDAGADDGMVNSHRFLGSNTALSAFHGYTRQLEATADFLADQRVGVDIFALRPVPAAGGEATPTLIAPAGELDLSVARGAEIGVEVVVRTRGVGHLFPGGTIDSNMPWLELALLDAEGRPLLMSGGMDEQRFVDPDAHFYRGVFLDEAGQELNKRNGWDRRAAVYVRMIPPGAADTVHYRFTVPEDATGEIYLRARLNYRKHKQAYNRWALGATPDVEQPALALALPRVDTRQWVYDDSKVIELPTVLMAEDTLRLTVVEGAAPGLWADGEPAVGTSHVHLRPDLRGRFNDFGIGLLLQGDVRRAIEAFRWVQQIDPAYADGFINEARAWINEGSLGQGETALEKAFALEPDSFKASYFMAQVAAAYGEYDRAIELLERVKRDFPYDRQVRIDLGRIDYLTGRYDDAVDELLAALQIDPEELAAHYTLMLTYQAMGEPEKAAIHESRYRRYKEDEDIQALTGPFRLENPGANREALPIHFHELTPPAGRYSAGDRFPIEAFLEGGPYNRPPTVFPGPTAPWLRSQAGAPAAKDQAGMFVDATAAAGIDFVHVSGAFGDKWFPETNGTGVSVFDADGDGWQDLLFVQGMPWPGHEEAVPEGLRDATMKLYRNRTDGRFTDVTEAAGLNVQIYGVAAAPADFDNDGDTDVYVTAYGPNRLFRNEGGGRFVDVTERAGVGHPGWSTCAAWIDYDRDGDLDLYACNYLRWSPGIHLYCSIDGTSRSYCNPKAFEGEPSVLYRNDGDGRFTDVTREAGVYAAGGKSLGVVVADFNGDGWPDLAVANDTEPNYLFENQRDGTFREVGMVSGMAVDSAGMARAGMGIDAADYRNDDRLTIAIGNFSNEMIGLFEPTANGVFVDVAGRSQLGRSSFLPLTFALFFFDYDLNGWLDMLAINGHIYEQVQEIEPSNSYEQLPLLYRNEGDGRFTDVAAEVGGPLAVKIAGRGGAYADFDRDGDLDVAVTTKEGPAYLWRNTRRDGDDRPHVLRLRLRGTASNRDAIGAAVTVTSGDWRQTQLVRSGSSYASQSELTLTFGLGDRETVDSIDIHWPLGETTRLEGEALAGGADQELIIVEGSGISERLPLRPH